MKVRHFRERVLEKVEEAATSGDEEATAKIIDYARAVLLALAGHGADEDVDLEKLSVVTATAARILSFHPEYVRDLVRRNVLKGSKENGEYRIQFPELVAFLIGLRRPARDVALVVPSHLPGLRPATLQELRRRSWAIWRRPQQGPQTGEQPA